MKFRTNEPALVVFVNKEKNCVFRKGFYETEDKEEISALKKAKGVFEIDSENGIDEKNSEEVEGSRLKAKNSEGGDRKFPEENKSNEMKQAKTVTKKKRKKAPGAGNRAKKADSAGKKRPGRPRKSK